jgi:peptidoglycan/xylan/chitin deacetylase (PgdA/CDA1 family)
LVPLGSPPAEFSCTQQARRPGLNGCFDGTHRVKVERSGAERAREAALKATGLLTALEWLDRRAQSPRLRVLMFHRIQNHEGCGTLAEPALISAQPSIFAEEMAYLATRYRPVGADDVLRAIDGHPLPERAVLVTFDDGYRDFQEHAVPVLRRLAIPSVLFVVTAFASDPSAVFWWDHLYQIVQRATVREATLPGTGRLDLSTPEARQASALKARRYLQELTRGQAERLTAALGERLAVPPTPFRSVLDWQELAALDRHGVTVAAHSRRHRRMNGLGPADLAEEVVGCRDDFVAALGRHPTLFAYPHGGYDAAAVRAVAGAGYAAAFAADGGFTDLTGSDQFSIPRMDVWQNSFTHLRLDLTRAFAGYVGLRAALSS